MHLAVDYSVVQPPPPPVPGVLIIKHHNLNSVCLVNTIIYPRNHKAQITTIYQLRDPQILLLIPCLSIFERPSY